jgi:hypothetical protein
VSILPPIGAARTQSGFIACMLRLLQKWQPQSREWHKVIYQIQRALTPEFKNIASILGLVIESILAETVTVLVILLAGVTKKRQQDDIRHAQ